MKCVNERVVDMQGCDHRTICRFPFKNNNYGLIRGIIEEWGDEAIALRQRGLEGEKIGM